MINETAPKLSNVYTDGSAKYPMQRFAAIGTYAAYHICEPDRPPITEEEKQASIARDSDSSTIKLYSPLRVAFPSSNRTEAAGVLLALRRPGPIHMWGRQRKRGGTTQQDPARAPKQVLQAMGTPTARRHMAKRWKWWSRGGETPSRSPRS